MDKSTKDKKDAITETSKPETDSSSSTSSTDTLTEIESKTPPVSKSIRIKETADTASNESSRETLEEFKAYSEPNPQQNVKKIKRVTKFVKSADDSESDDKRQSKHVLMSSKLKQVRTISSPDDDSDEPRPFLGSSKSQHVRKGFGSSDDDDKDISNLQEGNVFVYMVIPPDGGYGWFIVFISFLCQVVVDGIVLTVGIILPHIATEFEIPGSKVVLVGSLQVGCYFLAGTISSALLNKFGFRPVAMAGSVLSITVLTISTFSTNLSMMLFFYSFLGGPGLSMVWVSSQLIIGYYFEKYRPIANGISCSGAGAGIMIFSYMNSVLVKQLGWRNLMRVHVGFLGLVFLMVLSFIEVAPTRIGTVKEPLLQQVEDTESESLDILTDMTRFSRYTLKVYDNSYPLEEEFEARLTKVDAQLPVVEKPPGCCSLCCKLYCSSCFNCWQRHKEKIAREKASKRYVIKHDLIDRQDFFYMGPVAQTEPPEVEGFRSTVHRATLTDEAGAWRTISLDELDTNFQRSTVINTLSTMHINREEPQKGYQSYGEFKQTAPHPILAFLSPKNLVHPKIRKVISLLFDFRLLAIAEFRILLLSAFLFPMGFNIPFVYSTVRVEIDPSDAKLISPTIGFSNFIFRIASGFIAFKYREYTTIICGGGMFFGGVAVLISAFYGLDVLWFQLVYGMCYGIAPAFYSTLRAIIYVRSLGLDKLTNAFGLTALAMGMGVFIGTTTGGILNDLTGNYTASFIFAGCCICLSGALKLMLPLYIKHINAKKVKNLKK